MPSPTPTLTELHRAYLAGRANTAQPCRTAFDEDNARAISRLKSRGITTTPELIATLPTLPTKLKRFGIGWLERTSPPGTERVLLRMLKEDLEFRSTCAHTLGMLKSRRALRELVRIANRQLSSKIPDTKWLEAVIYGLKTSDNAEAVEILVSIYERADLPGWLRGNAGDALGFASQLQDRRTRVFRRVWSAAQSELHDLDIEVVFWSMYVIMQLATNCYGTGNQRTNCRFDVVLPRLREIAETDQRLAPGFWWPMCGEAQDAIEVIVTGTGPMIDAGERWRSNPERGAASAGSRSPEAADGRVRPAI